jgi:hypothetical protein
MTEIPCYLSSQTDKGMEGRQLGNKKNVSFHSVSEARDDGGQLEG